VERRQFIKLIAASTLTTSCMADADGNTFTVSQTEGPYYPVVPIGNSSNLLLADNHLGSPLKLSGKVFDTDGNALSQARVEIWQCDGKGIYLHPNAPETSTFDQNFSGFGATVTDSNGSYEFTTIVPVPYTGRPPHIHTKVFLADREVLTSQIYLRNSGGDSRLKIDLTETPNAILTATFDFVVNV